MAIQTYIFYASGTIDGVPGTFAANTAVDVDTNTNTVIATRPIGSAQAPITGIWYGAFADLSFRSNVRDYGAKGDGVTDDTASIASAFAAISNTTGGMLFFPTGNYLTTGVVIQSASNFIVYGERGANIWISPNTVATPNLATHNVFTIADCTDFAVEGITIDARRDTIAADQFLTVNASSGQKNVTVQDGTKYVVGMAVSVFGGLTANSGNEKTFNDSNLLISSINGNVLTLNTNLSHTYTGTGSSGGAFVTQYQTGGVVSYSVAGRSLGNEDAQNGLHLLNCQRFVIRNCVAQNTWESPIKMGTGFAATNVTDACSYGVVLGNLCKHGYDQGVSVWNSKYITVTGNKCEDAGWAGISFSHSSDCTASGNVCVNNIYSPPFDLNEGTGIAVEGGVRVVVQGNVCSTNNSNGVRLNISPMFGGASLSQGVTGSLSAGATSITLSGTNSAFVTGGSYTIVDPSNNQIRETIYVTNVSGATLTISPALRNSYASGPTIFGRFGEDVLVTGNVCSLQTLGAGIHTDQQINLRIFSNDCSKNGFSGTAFTDTQGTYGIHLHSFCQQAVVEANTCSYNSQEGIVIDNDNAAVIVQNNSCNNNGISGTNQKMGIKLYGLIDGTIQGNECNFNTHSGIYTQDGNVTTSRLIITDNTCINNSTSGIWLDNGGNEILIRGNKIAYNGDAGMKILGYKDSIFLGNLCYNQNGQEGIRFDDGTISRVCTDNKVYDNLLFDDRGGSAAQSWGFRELNNSARTIVRGNRVFGNTNSAQVSLVSTSALVSDLSYRTATATDYTVLFTDDVISVTSTASARTITLPTPSAVPGRTYIVKDESGGAATHSITVKSASGNIDGTAGSTGIPITTNYGSMRVYSNGSNYFTI
jgi:parallel beta-helix repeat protein